MFSAISVQLKSNNMTLLELSKIAQAYYEGLKAPSLVQGWEKYVATDGTQCMFVHSDYEPLQGEAVFYFCVRNRNVMCQLYKNNIIEQNGKI